MYLLSMDIIPLKSHLGHQDEKGLVAGNGKVKGGLDVVPREGRVGHEHIKLGGLACGLDLRASTQWWYADLVVMIVSIWRATQASRQAGRALKPGPSVPRTDTTQPVAENLTASILQRGPCPMDA